MLDRFEARIIPRQRYIEYKTSPYTLVTVQFDIVQDGVPFDNGYGGRFECCDIVLRELVAAADDFLANRITQDRCLSFEIPYIAGGCCHYSYYYDIKVGATPEESCWEFKFAPGLSAGDKKIAYSCRLDRAHIAVLRDSLARQIDAFDWEDRGKTEYFRFDLPDKPYEWCYSARQLEKQLNGLLNGDRLNAIYVNGHNYADPLKVKENFVNYYLGSRVYLDFEKWQIDLLAHAMGLFEIRIFERHEVKRTRFYDRLEDPVNVLCDTGYVFGYSYAGQMVQSVKVKSTNWFPWEALGFDKSKLSDPAELPDSLFFELENKSRLTIAGGDDDFMIKVEPPEGFSL